MPTYYDENTKTWFCKFYYQDYTWKRKQKLKRGFKLQRDAKEYERTFLEQMQGTPDMSFHSLYNIYIADYEHRARQSSIDSKKSVFKKCILPYFESKAVNTITPADIRQWQNTMIDQGFKPSYLGKMNSALVTILNYAVQYYSLPSNPCIIAGTMGCRTKSLNFWTQKEYIKVVEYITDPAAHLTMQLLFYGGFRFGEVLALTLSDIDLDTKTIKISKSGQRKKGVIVTGPPKTANGYRTVPMPDKVIDELKSYCDKLYGLRECDFIFDYSKMLIRGNMQRASKSAGVPFIRIHDLRHSHVSMLIDMGFNAHLIADRIGDTVKMVNDTYGHLYPERKNDVADKLNSLLK